jgi:rhodanese-related sulfurtransferase
MKTIDRQELERRIDDGSVVVLEALPAAYFEAEHLPGALNLPLDDLEQRVAALVPDRSTSIVTYCSGPGCPNSRIAADQLTALGYTDVRAFEGGKEAWFAAGLAFERSEVAS